MMIAFLHPRQRVPRASLAAALLVAVCLQSIPGGTSAQIQQSVKIANFSFAPASISVTAGQTVIWTNADSVAHTTTSATGLWNSGPLQPGATFSQTFSAAGTFAYRCMIHPNMIGTVRVSPAPSGTLTTPAAAPAIAPLPAAVTPRSQAAGTLLVTYQPGWDLAAGPTGTVLSGTDGSLYALRAGDGGYENLPAGTALTAGSGYWAHFASTTTEPMPADVGQTALAVTLPAGQWLLIGNPGADTISVAGADEVLIYDPAKGYSATISLPPGQGAWAFSSGGAMLTMAPAGNATVIPH